MPNFDGGSLGIEVVAVWGVGADTVGLGLASVPFGEGVSLGEDEGVGVGVVTDAGVVGCCEALGRGGEGGGLVGGTVGWTVGSGDAMVCPHSGGFGYPAIPQTSPDRGSGRIALAASVRTARPEAPASARTHFCCRGGASAAVPKSITTATRLPEPAGVDPQIVLKSPATRGDTPPVDASTWAAKRQPSTDPSPGVEMAGPRCAYSQVLPVQCQYDQ